MLKNLLVGFAFMVIVQVLQAEDELICEDETKTLGCGKQIINVTNAIFGRTKRKCGWAVVFLRCKSNVLEIVSTMCNGKNECQITADINVFGNPCRHSWSDPYLDISYDCIEKITTASLATTTKTTKTTTTTTTTTIVTSTTTKVTKSPTTIGVKETTSYINVRPNSGGINSVTEDNLDRSITDVNKEMGQGSMASITGPVIGLTLGAFLIIVIVLITLRQKRKQKKYHYQDRKNAPSFQNKTYATAIYKPNNVKNSNTYLENKEKNPTYQNLANAAVASPLVRQSTDTSSQSSLLENEDKNSCAVEVALVHNTKQNPDRVQNKIKKRVNEYVYTGIKNTNEQVQGASSAELKTSHKTGAGNRKYQHNPTSAELKRSHKAGTENTTHQQNAFSAELKTFHKTGTENKKQQQSTSSFESMSKMTKETVNPDDKNLNDLKCDSYYLDMTVKDIKTKDIDIKYMTMNRTPSTPEDLSIRLYVNDMNSNSYCNIQINNKEQRNRAKEDTFYENVPVDKNVEESTYEPYHVGQ